MSSWWAENCSGPLDRRRLKEAATAKYVRVTIEATGQVTEGHASEKALKEFKDVNDTRQLDEKAQRTLEDPTFIAPLANDREVFASHSEKAVVIKDPSREDGGTIFKHETPNDRAAKLAERDKEKWNY